jgi:ABC-type nitrate/sulfonate/bicarbonate transport system substrate-binding protein
MKKTNYSNMSSNSSQIPLRISAFKDISAFILETIQKDDNFNLKIKYVKDANEAHEDLKNHSADIVFMSYDDTLSVALQENYDDIAAFMPIHGGILDLCGKIDLATHENRVGIDTNSGYARALRVYLHHYFSNIEDYHQLHWPQVGATNLRYQKLIDGKIDATLLNPPFSYQSSVHRIATLTHNSIIPDYQGVVANLNKSWLDNPTHQVLLNQFIKIYQQTLKKMQTQPEITINKLVDFYHLSPAIATAIYQRLWEADGLNTTLSFNETALTETELIFSNDTQIKIPPYRNWILSSLF